MLFVRLRFCTAVVKTSTHGDRVDAGLFDLAQDDKVVSHKRV